MEWLVLALLAGSVLASLWVWAALVLAKRADEEWSVGLEQWRAAERESERDPPPPPG